MRKLSCHPTDAMLHQFALGDLDPAMAIMVSSHLEWCETCQQRVSWLEATIAEQQLGSATLSSQKMVGGEGEGGESSHQAASLNHLLNTLMAKLADETAMREAPAHDEAQAIKLALKDHQFVLPRALARHREQIGPWSRLPGQLQRASVAVGGASKMNFIYMAEGSALPEHSHKGQEITLVLSGEFMDEQGLYQPGDFIVRTADDKHTPQTVASQSCLCLTLLDAPLHFSSGLATLLNPFSQLFFR
jgi:putative transcriptional regulator